MATSQPPLPDDSVYAQFCHLYIAGASQELGGMEELNARLQIPTEIMGATDGKSRYRRTGPIQVQWTARRILLQKQSIIDVFGSDAVSNTGPNGYGNYNWDQLIFDIVEQFQSGFPSSVAKSGGWTLRYCKITEYGVGHSDAYQFFMEDVTGMALGMFQQSWS